jgi:lipopolysaccharide transport system ATP-binding protein
VYFSATNEQLWMLCDMTDAIIEVDDLGKRYRIGALKKPRTRAQEIRRLAAAPFDWLARTLRAASDEETLWALRHVSFQVRRGEVVGIIGRNGAGKSTLLKILSRITEPSEGRAVIRGRVGSLLEVGTGFHPELTGRENVYLNGAILGMKRAEIARKFDEIVAFAEVEKFIDTPVKHYSSGMYVRLAFAVAAHLETEVLLVDEVLAVGDLPFQEKCLGKMANVAHEGRTVLFVSHNISAVEQLCDRAVVLARGGVAACGPAKETTQSYWRSVHESPAESLADRTDRRGTRALKFVGLKLLDAKGGETAYATAGADATLALEYESKSEHPLQNVHVAMAVRGRMDEPVCHLSTRVASHDFEKVPARGVFLCRLPKLPLQPGRYAITVFCSVGGDIADWVQQAGTFQVQSGPFFQTGLLPPPQYGSLLVAHSWAVAESSPAGAAPALTGDAR